jgi:ubiquinone/menaquinone biosynthesis C-methylase UbiE
MSHMGVEIVDIDHMPRGGPDASWLDRRLETNCQEYLDRDDVDDELKRRVVNSLDRIGTVFKEHERNARLVLNQMADVPDPAILELGAGHGTLSRLIIDMHPTATVTVTDLDPASVTAIAAGDLGRHPRAAVRVMDATAIDAPDRSYDLAVFAMSFHHLPPRQAVRAFAEGTRVADQLLIIDLQRLPSRLHLVQLATFAPLAAVVPLAHGGFISSLRAHSRPALRALARHADPDIDLRWRYTAWGPQVVVASR